jgi:peptide/nickel transport system substrate-binding protein
MMRAGFPWGAAAAAAAMLLAVEFVAPIPALAQGTLMVAMTAGDIPVTTGNPDQGFEGYRFVGWSLYDALGNWDLSQFDKPSDIKPGLATEWNVDPNNPKRWIYKLRQGVKWHDGCDFTADDVVWNFRMRTDKDAPFFNTQQFALTRGFLVNFESIEKVDDHTVAINTKFVASTFPYSMSYVLMISRCRADAVKFDWNAYALAPSGTGPYRFDRFVPHERLELLPNKAYWDPKRVPKQDRMVLLPMPEASTRVAALLSGQVNFVEAPPPDSIARLKSAGMQIITNVYPHNWPYILNAERGPFQDVRVRRAANYAVNRADVVELLGGFATEEYGTVPTNQPYYGKPMRYEYNPEKAKALLKEAGCLPCKVTFAISTSGSGQMQPLPMNELVKSQLDAVGFNVTLKVMDWNALLEITRGGVEKFPDIDGLNQSRAVLDPEAAMLRTASKKFWTPNGANWGHYYTPETEALVEQAFTTFELAPRMQALTKLHEKLTEDAFMLFVVHDLNPRALSPKVKGFVQAQNWFQDMTPITLAP